ncbi:MAG: hypothetical protein AB7G12_05700 [Thermoanaerobaculia bacterium]
MEEPFETRGLRARQASRQLVELLPRRGAVGDLDEEVDRRRIAEA